MNKPTETQAIILEKVQHLTSEQQLEVLNYIEFMQFKSHQPNLDSRSRRQWREIRGKASYPLVGEDAQDWIARTRREDEEHRDLNFRSSNED